MIRYGSFAEVTNGVIGFVPWVKDKVRRYIWGIVWPGIFAITMTCLLAYGQHKMAEIFASASIALVTIKLFMVASQLILMSFTAALLWGMHHTSQAVMPTFSVEIPRFEPRPPPNLEAGETWEEWLRKGVRIGRWQGEVGSLEPGDIAWMQIVDVHPFIAAESRMGKSTLLWAILWELKPAIEAGVVEIILFDPKNGMEMAPAVALGLVKSMERMGRPEGQVDEVDNFFYGQDVGHPDPNNPERWIGKKYEETFVPPLEHHVQLMRERASEVRGSMQWIPASRKHPRRIVIVDEGASLARPSANLNTRQRIISAMLNLCDQGAGAGYTIITATQHPDVKKVPWRHGLIGAGLCGRVKTWDAVDMVLGRGSYARGAWGDQLSSKVKGVFFMSGHGAWQLRVQNAKPKFTRKPPDRGGGKEIEEFNPSSEPTNAQLAQVVPFRNRNIWPVRENVGGDREVGAA